MAGNDKVGALLDRLEGLLERVEMLVPARRGAPDWSAAYAFRWRRQPNGGYIQAVLHPHHIRLVDLQGIDRQKGELERNTRQFIEGLPANNALLWGSRGTGKSSLVKALVNEYCERGLRVIEVDKNDLIDLPDIVDHIYGRPERFLLFCDDLSFEADDPSYKALKAILDGSVHAPPENVLIYATSNRRHLLPEYMRDNLDAHHVDGEIHHSEAVEEKISLSERFGLWLSFYPFKQDQYLDIVRHWLEVFEVQARDDEEVRKAALQWALVRGSRSGRSAYQFARDWAGRSALAD
ncbi:MAG: ATP-binding protein [Gammaproteobacteria bacterium]|nr:ATP-binding protein [Gammaproteobacteria bacterium]